MKSKVIVVLYHITSFLTLLNNFSGFIKIVCNKKTILTLLIYNWCIELIDR